MTAPAAQCPWHRRVRQHLGHSIKWRIVVVFVLLASAGAAVFVIGAQRAFAVGWRDAARPLLADYVAHLASEVTGGGPTPQLARARDAREKEHHATHNRQRGRHQPRRANRAPGHW